MGSIFNRDFIEFIDHLNKSDVEYILVGGMAVILHGYVRTTGDMDIWVKKTPENYKRIINAFRTFGLSVFDMSEEKFMGTEFDVWSFGREPVKIEIMTAVKGLDFDEAFGMAKYYDEDGISIRFLHLSSLIQAKQASGRHRDMDDIEQLTKDK
jgi:hypothetical protein